MLDLNYGYSDWLAKSDEIGWKLDDVLRLMGDAKAALDAACWDILGKATGQQVWMLLGQVNSVW